MELTDYIVIAVVFAILLACLVVDWWVRNHDDELDRAARRRIKRELARREEECRD